MPNENEEYSSSLSLLFKFEDESESFANGVEVGMIYQQLKDMPEKLDCGFDEGLPLHSANFKTLHSMAWALRYIIETKPTGVEGWTAFRFTKPKPEVFLKVVK